MYNHTSSGGKTWQRLKNGSITRLLPGHDAVADIENTIDIENLLSHRTSIAVLPFTDRIGKSNQAHFCAGVAGEILNTLARIPGLRVVPRVASFNFSSEEDVLATGVKLGVDILLGGC